MRRILGAHITLIAKNTVEYSTKAVKYSDYLLTEMTDSDEHARTFAYSHRHVSTSKHVWD